MNKINAGVIPIDKFWPGRIFATRGVRHEVVLEDFIAAIKRHCAGDWGDVCLEDHDANETALEEGGRLFSVYHDRAGVKFWIITEADRSATTVLLPTDY